jgi:molybdopterin molybdotransferase
VVGPSSHLLGSLAASNALIQIPADVTELPAGSNVEVWLL